MPSEGCPPARTHRPPRQPQPRARRLSIELPTAPRSLASRPRKQACGVRRLVSQSSYPLRSDRLTRAGVGPSGNATCGGASLDGVLVSVIVGVAAPASAVVLWGLFAAPRASRRLPVRARVPFELSVFVLAVAALVAVDWPAIAIAFAAASGVNAVLLTRLDQWEQ
ncbi:MAG TPA: YrdB family protein [Solirubrobacteraceae bacterium]